MLRVLVDVFAVDICLDTYSYEPWSASDVHVRPHYLPDCLPVKKIVSSPLERASGMRTMLVA